MESDFEIGGRKFKLRKIDAFKQFHIVRRIGPILSEMLPAMKNIAKGDTKQDWDQIAEFVTPIMNGLSKLSDADADRVLFGLLSGVEVQHMGSWARVANDSMLMIQDMELPVMMQVAGRAFMFNLAGFFAGLPQQ